MQNYNAKLKRKKGFTLIELLVVIAIIGLLASIVAVAVNNVRKKGRDTKRLADIKAIQTALELYNDEVGGYPECTDADSGDNYWCGQCGPGSVNEMGAALQPLIDKGYLAKIPADPKNDSANNTYCYTYEYYTPNHTNIGNVKCGGVGVENFKYVLRFATEKNIYSSLPEFSLTRSESGKEYCLTNL